ncbi:hypothetical protein ACFT7S_01980 [Streptomyces sp. NPDC057136]|uniref:hypothetical protein n=1 Tax=Streptomyces sp. NPDC057136 TaxID=3346029 RepID=UPI0036453A06
MEVSRRLRIARETVRWQRATQDPLEPTPTVDDLFVIYLGEPVDQSLIDRLQAAGGTRVQAHNPYWDTHGVTIADPDGYRLVLCSRTWA